MMELKYLGKQVALSDGPEEFELDRVPSPAPDDLYAARFTCPEFTSICPATGQPDFAHLIIDYVPGAWLVESKSLKLFLTSFRGHGAFHEACTMLVAKRLKAFLEPRCIRVAAFWYPRGGIPIDVLYQDDDGMAAYGAVMLPLEVPPYRGRG